LSNTPNQYLHHYFIFSNQYKPIQIQQKPIKTHRTALSTGRQALGPSYFVIVSNPKICYNTIMKINISKKINTFYFICHQNRKTQRGNFFRNLINKHLDIFFFENNTWKNLSKNISQKQFQ